MSPAPGLSGRPDDGRSGGPPARNVNAERIGHYTAMQALRTGAPMRGRAASVELEVYDELERSGVPPIVERNAVRVQVCCELVWQAILKAIQEEKHDTAGELINRFVGYSLKAAKLWEAVSATRANTVDGEIDYEVLLERERE